MTADQVEALIEQGVEIPYQQATSSGATSVSFRKANLALKVKPQITPDGRVQMSLDVNKDTPNTQIATGAGVAIDTKHVKTDVLVENGGTIVIGGIYQQEERVNVTRIPFFGDLPYIGFMFRNTARIDNKNELLDLHFAEDRYRLPDFALRGLVSAEWPACPAISFGVAC